MKTTETSSQPITIGEAVRELRQECSLLIALTDNPEWGLTSYMLMLGRRIESLRNAANRAIGADPEP